MASFAYVAVDAAGRTRSGVVAADDLAAAERALARRSLAPLQLSAATPKKGRGSPRLNAKTLALTTRQLATLLAVTPVEEAVRSIALQADRASVRTVLSGVQASVLEGYRLSEAMRRQGKAFPDLYVAMVAAGESSGALGPILERMADGLEREEQVRGKVITALVYPAVLTVVAIGVVVALMTFVVPKVVDQFDTMNATLPLLTRVVIGISSVLQNWGWLIVLALAAGGVAFAVALRRPALRLRIDGISLKLPIVGRLQRDLHAARIARTLATVMAAGMPLLDGLRMTAGTAPNAVLRAATVSMAEAVREGGGLSAAMRRADVFPPILVHMTASGEAAGRLEIMLEKAADYLEREFSTFTAVMLSLLEPAIIVVMGAVVALIVLSILLPILQINTLAGG